MENTTIEMFFALCKEGMSLYWVDIVKADLPFLEKFMSPLELHPQIMEEYRDPAASSHIAPYEQTLFIKLPIQLGWDNINRDHLAIICLPQAPRWSDSPTHYADLLQIVLNFMNREGFLSLL